MHRAAVPSRFGFESGAADFSGGKRGKKPTAV